MSYHVSKSLIITHKVLNEATGELEPTEFTEVAKKSRIKGGFNLMYHKSYEEVVEAVISSNTDMRLFNWVTNQFTYKTSIAQLVHKQCSVQVSQPKFSKFIKLLLDVEYIRRVGRGVYMLNPFIYVPYKANAAELQNDWGDKSVKAKVDEALKEYM